MAYQAPPKDTKTAMLALWNTVIGSNGEGLVGIVSWMKENMITKAEWSDFRKKRRSAWIVAKDIVLIVIAILGTLIGLGVL